MEKRWSLTTIGKKSTKDLVKLLGADKQQWTQFAKINRNRFIEYVHNCPLNVKESNPSYNIAIPPEFVEVIEANKNEISLSKTHKVTQRRWIDHQPPNKKPRYDQNWRTPTLPLQKTLRNGGKIALEPLQGFALVDFKYVDLYCDIIVELNTLINNTNHTFITKKCMCSKAVLKGYNATSSALTVKCKICCRCGTYYMTFVFGEKITIDGREYFENGMRFATLTQHIKMRFCLGQKLDLYFGIQNMKRGIFNVGEKQMVIDKHFILNLNVNRRQKHVIWKRHRDKRKRQQYKRRACVMTKRKTQRHKYTNTKQEYKSGAYSHEINVENTIEQNVNNENEQ